MVEETPWQQALRYANRANPYPFYDELRKTPVARQPDGTYVVSTYRELVALLHDPRVSSDTRKRPGGGPRRARARRRGSGAEHHHEDPPEHDVDRRRMMRHFGPPDAPHMIADLEPEIRRIVAGLLDGMKGKTRIDVVDEFAYPGAGDRDLQGPGRAAGGRSRASTAGSRRPWTGSGLRPGGERPGGAAPRSGGSRGQVAEFEQFLADLIDQYRQAARPGHALGDGATTTARRGACARSRSSATRCSCSSPGTRPRST